MLRPLAAAAINSVTPTTATAYTAAAGGGFTGEIDVFGQRVVQRISIAPHQVVAKVCALPGLDTLTP